MYREVSGADARSTVDVAWELGVRYFDTAPHYGLGLSERRLNAFQAPPA
jgi:D-threo-aldose 1-dehydrogenase